MNKLIIDEEDLINLVRGKGHSTHFPLESTKCIKCFGIKKQEELIEDVRDKATVLSDEDIEIISDGLIELMSDDRISYNFSNKLQETINKLKE